MKSFESSALTYDVCVCRPAGAVDAYVANVRPIKITLRFFVAVARINEKVDNMQCTSHESARTYNYIYSLRISLAFVVSKCSSMFGAIYANKWGDKMVWRLDGAAIWELVVYACGNRQKRGALTHNQKHERKMRITRSEDTILCVIYHRHYGRVWRRTGYGEVQFFIW